MGWLSSEVLPKGMDDGWVNVEAEIPPKSGRFILLCFKPHYFSPLRSSLYHDSIMILRPHT
jgi:hypothetical protein